MSPRPYKSLKILRDGQVLDLGGVKVKMIEGEIQPGDLYVAERNTGPKLLTCERVDSEMGWIVPREDAYCFDLPECVKVDAA